MRCPECGTNNVESFVINGDDFPPTNVIKCYECRRSFEERLE